MRVALAFLALAVALEDASTNAGLWSRLRRIEASFRDGDATALRSSVSGTAKVRVDLRDLTDGQATYGPGQLQVVFGHIFAEHRTRAFTFGQDDVRISGPGTAFAKGRWVRRTRPMGQEIVDSVTFTLREEGGDWRVVEIRSSR